MLPESQFILLPRRGIRASGASPAAEVLRNLPRLASTEKPKRGELSFLPNHSVLVLDLITQIDNGPKLVEMTYETEELVNQPNSPLRALPVVRYNLARPVLYSIRHASPTATAGSKIQITIECVKLERRIDYHIVTLSRSTTSQLRVEMRVTQTAMGACLSAFAHFGLIGFIFTVAKLTGAHFDLTFRCRVALVSELKSNRLA